MLRPFARDVNCTLRETIIGCFRLMEFPITETIRAVGSGSRRNELWDRLEDKRC